MKNKFDAVKAIIFDMDGVLVDSKELHEEAEIKACRKFGVKAPIEAWSEFNGTTANLFFTTLINRYATRPVRLSDISDYNMALYLKLADKKLRMVKGSLKFLRAARKNFKHIALVTSGRKPNQKFAFRKFKLDKYFDLILTGEEVVNGKPHPEPFLTAAQRLGLAPSACVVIEDADNGIRSARAAGCLPIGLTTTMPRECLLEAGAQAVFDNYEEISGHFGF